jgi:hypothetical protein
MSFGLDLVRAHLVSDELFKVLSSVASMVWCAVGHHHLFGLAELDCGRSHIRLHSPVSRQQLDPALPRRLAVNRIAIDDEDIYRRQAFDLIGKPSPRFFAQVCRLSRDTISV